MAKIARREQGRDAVLLFCLAARGLETGEDGGEGDTAREVGLRVEEELRVVDAR